MTEWQLHMWNTKKGYSWQGMGSSFKELLIKEMANTCCSLGINLPLKDNSNRSLSVGSMVKSSPANEGDMGSIPYVRRSHIPQSKSMCHNYWACALEPGSCNNWAHVPKLPKPKCPGVHPLQQEAQALLLESSPRSREDQAQPKTDNKVVFKKVILINTKLSSCPMETE